MAPLQWTVTLAFGLCLAWAFTLALSLNNDIQRLGTVCRKIGLDSPSSVAEPGKSDDMAVIDATLTQNTTQYRELATTVTQGLDAVIAQCTDLAALAKQASTELKSGNAVQQSTGTSIKTLAVDATSIASCFESVTIRMATMTSAARESADQVGIIIGATEKMSSTIAAIALNAEKARGVAGAAVSNVNAASNRVDELGTAALEISKVTDVIVEIAEQTKLLALNATIEAARAGEAGKGFAVVANEVKELALQTNNAIAEIRNKVEAMQHSTDNTIAEIGAIDQTIKAVNEIVVTIAGAVEEQSIPTKDIVKQLNQGVSGIETIRDTVNSTAAEVCETASRINKMAAISQELATRIDPAPQANIDIYPLLSSLAQQAGDLQSTSEGLLAKVQVKLRG
jgi:methyl-accepting chemotaxis protein